jgi:fibro-slime domain-containing protein
MDYWRRLGVLSAVLWLIGGAGCAGVKPSESGSTGKGGGGGGKRDGGSVDYGGVNLPDSISTTCGNGKLDQGEACDDGNTAPGDGCTPLCQIENGYSCPTPGQACVRTAHCGDGILTSPEACDDGNMKGGDGCSADCTMVETGWRCPVPGRPCVPICGDGIIETGETCDDGNTADKDGCSSTCQLEPGASCSGTPSVCVVAKCGNGLKEAGEACDCGTDPTKLPTGCTGPNGLFNGDGSGCSKTCTQEPTCRTASTSCTAGTAGTTGACSTSCGNGNIEAGEQCDDGNLADGDGCSSTCTIEPGFTCKNVTKNDTADCTQPGNMGTDANGNAIQCLELPVKYRDFKNESVSGGHPDFFYLGAYWPKTDARYQSIASVQGQAANMDYVRRYCVPNSSGPARQNDSTARAWDIAQANLDCTGKPTFNTKRMGCNNVATLADCQFTDFSHDTNGGNVPNYNTAPPAGYGPAGLSCTNYSPTCGLTYVGGTDGHPMYHGCAPVVTSPSTFAQWWQDGSWETDGMNASKHAVGTLELGPTTLDGQTGYYQFSSAQNSVYGGFYPFDPPANVFPLYYTQAELMMTNAMTGLVDQGSPNGPGTTYAMPDGEQLLCNLWPYWYSPYHGSAVTAFGGGEGCKGNQYLFPPSVSFATNPNGNWINAMQGWYHDSWFSTEARYLFAFNGPFQLQFYGDDDTFVFINGVLVVDLGGVHQRLPGKVSVDASGMATTQEGGDVYLPGETLPAGANVGDLIPCDGSANAVDPVTKVAFNKTGTGNCSASETTCDCRSRKLNLNLTTGSTYEIAIFGRDGHPTESNFQLTLSGFSTTQSQCGPYCGDGIRTGDEECDCGSGTMMSSDPSCNGMQNADGTYNGCTTSCTYGPFCGDGTTNGPEQCDNGANNGVAYTKTCNSGGCTSACTNSSCCGDTVVDADEGEECDLGTQNGVQGSSCDATCKIVVSVN